MARLFAEAVSLFERYLNALDDPEAGLVLYAMHAPGAIIRSGETMARAEDTDAASFAVLHRQIVAPGTDSLPRFVEAAPLGEPAPDTSDRSVVWFDLAEARSRRRLLAAVGFQIVNGSARIGWATLTAAPRNWTYEEGYLQSAADYPWMRISEPARARSLIDASYFRHYYRQPVRFISLPEARFSCQMSTVCCRHDFEITLPEEAQLVIDAIPWKRVNPQLDGIRLPKRADGKLQLKGVADTCRFLGPLGQCLIHQTLGRQPFGPCCVFPVTFAHTPASRAASRSPGKLLTPSSKRCMSC